MSLSPVPAPQNPTPSPALDRLSAHDRDTILRQLGISKIRKKRGIGAMMNRLAVPRAKGLPLALQMIAIPVCALIAAQLVTLALTVLLPPRPAARWNIDDVAAALGAGTVPDALERRDMQGPPDISGQGWLVSESSREALATRLGQTSDNVVLAFYTQLPVGGVAVPTNTRSPLAEMEQENTPGLSSLLIESARAQSIPGGPPPGGGPGPAGLPPGGFPGGMPPGGSGPRVPTMPGGQMPGAPRTPGAMPGRQMPGGQAPGAQAPGGQLPGGQPPAGRPGGAGQTPSGQPPGGQAPGAGGAGTSVPGSTGQTAGSGTTYDPAAPGAPGQTAAGARPGGLAPGRVGGPATPGVGAGPQAPGGLLPRIPAGQPVRSPVAEAASTQARGVPPANDATRAASAGTQANPGPALAQARPTSASDPSGVGTGTPAPQATRLAQSVPQGDPQPIPFRRQHASIFNMASPPFIEGDFVAAARQADGSWLAVAPREEPFPNAWQQRVILWFALSLAIISPLAWLFARRIVLPLREFASAAEQLGRDPSAQIPPLSGPAEIGGAANAFNQMRNRLRAFVDDRTTMVGAISHDLRTPLTRLRFRIEDVPDEQRDGLLKEVTEMEAMISQVIAFIRDASAPGARERVDICDLVGKSVEDARLVGGEVTIERPAHVQVDVDPVGIRRLLDNLIENALKYGDTARIRLGARSGEALVEIIDGGEGFPEEEFDLVFEPFYRSASARKSAKKGSGLGLSVCRSIARAHGGDVSFEHGDKGFVTRLSLPAAYTIAARKAG